MSFGTNKLTKHNFGMMSQCKETKVRKGDCGCHPYPKCAACRDLGKIPPGIFCPEGCQASMDMEKRIEDNRRKRDIETAGLEALRDMVKTLKRENTHLHLEIAGKYGIEHLREWNSRLRGIVREQKKEIKMLMGALEDLQDDARAEDTAPACPEHCAGCPQLVTHGPGDWQCKDPGSCHFKVGGSE